MVGLGRREQIVGTGLIFVGQPALACLGGGSGLTLLAPLGILALVAAAMVFSVTRAILHWLKVRYPRAIALGAALFVLGAGGFWLGASRWPTDLLACG